MAALGKEMWDKSNASYSLLPQRDEIFSGWWEEERQKRTVERWGELPR